jgi:serine/threonine protein phosphatase PrpC
VSLRTGILLGQAHPYLGAIDSISEGDLAVAISKGGASKVYDHVDPNEDAALWASGPGGVLLAVADGHSGAHGARAAMEALAERIAPAACASVAPCRGEDGWKDWLYGAVQTTNAQIVSATAALALTPAPTTLCLVVIRPAEELWASVGVGDSHIFRCAEGSARDCGWKGHPGTRERAHFLGYPEESWHRANTALGCASLTGVESIVLATDGLSEHGIGLDDPASAVACASAGARDIESSRRAQWLAREVASRANDAHRRQKSGDNIATAAWVGGANA